MKKAIISIVALTCLITGVYAQSGRRTKTTPDNPGTTKPTQIQLTQDAAEAEKEIETGYSESAPNAPRNISARSTREREREKQARKGSQPKPATGAQNTDENGEEVIKVDTSLVTIPVSVSDRNGFYITGLRQENFKIFEDGVEQKIEYFGKTEKPFTVVLLLDTSPSTDLKIDEIRAGANAFVDQLKPQDQVMVIEFDGNVHVLTEATTDRARIRKAISKADFGGGTSLYDAVDFSLSKRLDKVDGRKAIVLFTDGVDTTSYKANYYSTLDDAEESEAVIFPIYYNTFLDQVSMGGGGVMSTPPILGLPGSIGGQSLPNTIEDYRRGRAYLNELATVTGGKVFRADATPGGLTAAFESIAEELRRQYTLGYYPADSGSAGQRKKIRVRVDRPKLIVRARDSYIVGESVTASK